MPLADQAGDRPVFDVAAHWGTPLTARQIEALVVQRITAWPPLRRHQFEREGGTVVVHPEVLRLVMDEEYRREAGIARTAVGYRSHWTQAFEDGRPVVRLRAWRVETDPGMRYDEVRLRREEVLREHGDH